MSETASFVDPVFLARFGLSRVNLIDYFLHPLNPFRTPNNTSNEVLNMQGISIGMLMQPSLGHIPLTQMAAEEAYAKSLSKLMGDQYVRNWIRDKYPTELSTMSCNARSHKISHFFLP